jgi:hypothetical protein
MAALVEAAVEGDLMEAHQVQRQKLVKNRCRVHDVDWSVKARTPWWKV